MVYKTVEPVISSMGMGHKGQWIPIMVIRLNLQVHTADCESGFNTFIAQNMVKTACRNWLSPSTLVDLLTIKLEGW